MREVHLSTAEIISSSPIEKKRSTVSLNDKPTPYFNEEENAFFSAIGTIGRRETPFSHQDKFSLKLVKIILSLPLVLIRIAMILLLLMLTYPFIYMASMSCFGCNFSEKKPPNCFQKLVWKIYFPFARGILWCFGVWWLGKESESVKIQTQVIVVAPHSSFLDIFVIAAIIGCYSGFGKKASANVPVVGRGAKLARTILVDRTSAETRAMALETYLRRVTVESTQNPIKYVTFPEGTCTNRKSLISFRHGAFTANVPLQLICIHWKSINWFNLTWTAGGPSRLYLVFRLLMQPITRVSYHVSEVLYPNDNELSVEFAQRVELMASKRLKLPTSNHTFKDSFLAKHAKSRSLDVDKVCDFSLQDINDILDIKISIEKSKKILDRFSLCCGRRDNSVFLDLVGFAQYFNIPQHVVQDIYLNIINRINEHSIKNSVGSEIQQKTISFKHVLPLMYSFSERAESSNIDEAEIESGIRSINGAIQNELLKCWLEITEQENSKRFIRNNKEILFIWSIILVNQSRLPSPNVSSTI